MDRKKLIDAIEQQDTEAIGKMFPVWHILFKESNVYVDKDRCITITEKEYLQLAKNPRFNAFIIVDVDSDAVKAETELRANTGLINSINFQ